MEIESCGKRCDRAILIVRDQEAADNTLSYLLKDWGQRLYLIGRMEEYRYWWFALNHKTQNKDIERLLVWPNLAPSMYASFDPRVIHVTTYDVEDYARRVSLQWPRALVVWPPPLVTDPPDFKVTWAGIYDYR